MKEIARNKDGKFIKGHAGLKPKGAQTKSTKEIKDRIQQLMESYDEKKMIADLKSLKPPVRLKIMTGLLEYILPKLNKTDFNINTEKDEIIIVLPE